MTVIRTSVSGFCMGVRRAVNIAMETASVENHNVYTLGPLIHNKKVLDELKAKGIKILDEGEVAAPGATVIIRAHGIAPQIAENLNSMGIKIIDATCPKVKTSQQKVKEFAEKGYMIFLAGEKDHGEIISLKGFAESFKSSDISCYVIADQAEAEKAGEELINLKPDANAVLLGQTTISKDEFDLIGTKIKEFFPSLEIINTICNATIERQDALRELAGVVDAIIIAGGNDSANTRRLLSLAQSLGIPAWLAESSQDLPVEIKSYNKIGLAAGASAPDSLINEIEDEIEEAIYSRQGC